MTTRLLLYNAALGQLGERELASLSENRAPRRYLDQVWSAGAVDKILSAGQWKFARRSVRMDADTGLDANFGWRFAFSRPADYIRALDICSDEFFSSPLESYAEEAGIFYAAIETFYMGYVSNDASYGGNLGSWPPAVAEYAEHFLADKILVKLTGNKTEVADLKKATHKALTKAQSLEAMEGPTKYPPTGTWVQSRMGGRAGGWDRGSRSRLIG